MHRIPSKLFLQLVLRLSGFSQVVNMLLLDKKMLYIGLQLLNVGNVLDLFTPTPVSRNASATLLDSGNFVLQELHPDIGSVKRVLWQSFDYPTDTLLPERRIMGATMSEVISMLTNENMNMPDPKQPAFFVERHDREATRDDNLGNGSVNGQSISIVVAR
ncbi:hypothetical protein L6452_33976 [Arctium lappa]|uniref:Uncharacterized protein n=1 Tax=Arctium lappa TaxID=4217 RepID=A0ACB8YI45_ARCLA|nr:hypothetical protein L6452_33976 [Arctium lappa]